MTLLIMEKKLPFVASVLLCLMFTLPLLAQQNFTAVEIEPQTELAEVPTYDVFQLDIASLFTYVKANRKHVKMTLSLGDQDLPLEMFDNPMRRGDTKVTVRTENGDITLEPRQECLPFRIHSVRRWGRDSPDR